MNGGHGFIGGWYGSGVVFYWCWDAARLQQHQDRNQVLFTAYDPSRDLSPNLPTTTCEPAAANLSSSRGPSRSGSNSGCSTPNTRIGMCCSFKEEYEPNDYSSKVAPPQPPSSVVGGCQECGPPSAYKGGDSFSQNHRPVICKTESDSPVDYNSCRTASDLYAYKTSRDYGNQGSIDAKSENAVGSPEDNILKICAGCGRQIADRFYLYTEDTPWHVSCLQCSQCARTLDQEVTCFARDGNIYCRKDYQRSARRKWKKNGRGTMVW
ncbi:hypothetical protein V9T40_010564 [Parthenolecanium corni]|uniref:LIM zinc-binding domain-containing protein n=1 Tax=Parthenolecanium corni TaxID=536013 RepID=A0AAN9XYK4_9HEMI